MIFPLTSVPIILSHLNSHIVTLLPHIGLIPYSLILFQSIDLLTSFLFPSHKFSPSRFLKFWYIRTLQYYLHLNRNFAFLWSQNYEFFIICLATNSLTLRSTFYSTTCIVLHFTFRPSVHQEFTFLKIEQKWKLLGSIAKRQQRRQGHELGRLAKTYHGSLPQSL